MVNGISSSNINAVQFFNAQNAFKSATVNKEPDSKEPHVSDGVQLRDNDEMLKVVDVRDVKKYASLVGETNLSNDDIKYGLTYGRSVIADWVI